VIRAEDLAGFAKGERRKPPPRDGRMPRRPVIQTWDAHVGRQRVRAARRLMSVVKAYGSKSDTILHGHSNGARQLGDGGPAEDAFETGRQTSVLCAEHVESRSPSHSESLPCVNSAERGMGLSDSSRVAQE
jgi:hypothetical protein